MADLRVRAPEHFDVRRTAELLQEAGLIPPRTGERGEPRAADLVRTLNALDPNVVQEMLDGRKLPEGFLQLLDNDLAGLLSKREPVTTRRGNDLGSLGRALQAADVTPRDIRRAETLLKRLGYNPGTIDTQLGPSAREAIGRYQQAVGLLNPPNPEVRGELSDRTLGRLEKTAERVRKNGSNYLTPGMAGKRVKKLQDRLQRLGDFRPQPGDTPGVYGESTADAVLSFRKRHGGLENGIKSFGPKAQRALDQELANIAHDPFKTRNPAPPRRKAKDDRVERLAKNGGVGPGSPADVVKYVKEHLRAAGYNPNSESGVWDPHTQAMLNQFQRRSGLKETQRLGPGTWNRLKQSTLDTKNAFDPRQSIGERSNEVLRTERRLKKAGFNPGEVDGHYTRATERAADRLRRHFGIRGKNGVTKGTDKLISRRIRQKKDQALEARIPFYNELAPALQRAAKTALRMGLTVTSTTHGGHSATSNHFARNNADGKGHAIDVAELGTGNSFSAKCARFLRRFANTNFRELFYDHIPGFASPGRDHFDHVHLAL